MTCTKIEGISRNMEIEICCSRQPDRRPLEGNPDHGATWSSAAENEVTD